MRSTGRKGPYVTLADRLVTISAETHWHGAGRLKYTVAKGAYTER